MKKTEIRNQIRMLFTEHKSDLTEQSKIICQKILNSQEYKCAKIIFSYMALPDEVNLCDINNSALLEGKKVFLPHVIPNSNKMEFYEYKKNTPTITGEYGIKEPIIEHSKTNLFSYNYADDKILFLIPGRAFTLSGERLGRGKGFYDIFLEHIPETTTLTKAGVCFPFQILNNLPTSKTDVKMDFVYY